jgi:hypothetical protein
VDPSKPTEPQVDPASSIPRSRQGSDEAPEVLEGEVIPKGVPLGKPTVNMRETPPGPPAPGPGGPKKKGGKLRTTMIVVAALAVAFCLAGIATGLLLYNKATQPDRSNPVGTLDQYIIEKMNNRNQERAHLLECGSPKVTALDDLLAGIEKREQQYSVSISVSTGDLSVAMKDDSATINGKLLQGADVNGVFAEERQDWHFDLVREGGWRVCGAEHLS